MVISFCIKCFILICSKIVSVIDLTLEEETDAAKNKIFHK